MIRDAWASQADRAWAGLKRRLREPSPRRSLLRQGWLGLFAGLLVFSTLEQALQSRLGLRNADLLALLYGLGAAGLLLRTRAQSLGWAGRWEIEGRRLSAESRFLPGMFWVRLPVMVLPILATEALIHWVGFPKSSVWYGFAFGTFCLMTSWENAARSLVPRLQDARAKALRSRLAPHFIFNALNTLKAQIALDPAGAEAMTDRLARLFRQVLEVSDAPAIPLNQELAFVEAYLGIEQARLGDRLKVSVAIPEDLESAVVPPLSLQVLVENAVKHGVTPLEQGGEVRIGAARREGDLYLWVEDPGTGVSAQRGSGTALETLRQRLARPDDLIMACTPSGFRVGFHWRQS